MGENWGKCLKTKINSHKKKMKKIEQKFGKKQKRIHKLKTFKKIQKNQLARFFAKISKNEPFSAVLVEIWYIQKHTFD